MPFFNLPPAAAEPITEGGAAILKWFSPDFTPAMSVTKDWPLVSATDAAAVTGLYFAFVLFGVVVQMMSSAPKKEVKADKSSIMKIFQDEPLQIFMSLYNICQTSLCGYMIFKAVEEYKAQGYSPICNEPNWSHTGMASVLWLFYLSKVADFFDTIFIVARGKWRQFSVLHVYHHSSIFMVYWVNVNVGYTGDIYYTIVLNGFVHLVMYFYYFVTGLGFTVPKPLKKAITQMQMLQFVTMNMQAAYLLYTNCTSYPSRVLWFYLIYIITIFLLFNDFSNKTYKKTADKKKN
jgi:elongation of very long chain fatty acids protein 4